MSPPDLLVALDAVVEAFEELGVAYHVGGSVVSSAYGVPRATLDVDVVADLGPTDVDSVVARLEGTFYVSGDAVRQAVRGRSTFNVIHLATMMKVDVFVLSTRPFEQEAFRRRRLDTLEEGEGRRRYALATAEDVLLHKLHWYRLGGESSERQWHDVLGVLRVQGDALDAEYVRAWAEQLGVADLAERAFTEAGLQLPGKRR